MKKRTKSFVDAEVQGALAKRIALHWGIYLVVATMLLVGLRWLVNPFTPLSTHFSEALAMCGPMLIVMICLAPLFVYDAVKLSNRFTGPMVRLRSAVREIANGGRPERLNFRDGDFWQEVATDFNRAVDRIEPSTGDATESKAS